MSWSANISVTLPLVAEPPVQFEFTIARWMCLQGCKKPLIPSQVSRVFTHSTQFYFGDPPGKLLGWRNLCVGEKLQRSRAWLCLRITQQLSSAELAVSSSLAMPSSSHHTAHMQGEQAWTCPGTLLNLEPGRCLSSLLHAELYLEGVAPTENPFPSIPCI